MIYALQAPSRNLSTPYQNLEGHLDPDHPLSKRAFQSLDPKIRALVNSRPETIWQQDNRRLPRPLARYRQQIRAFAKQFIKPQAMHVDRGKDFNPSQFLQQAAKHGLLTDLLPQPFGSLPISLARYSPQWIQSLKTEELCAVCSGFGLLIGANALGAMPILISADLRAIRRHLLHAYQKTKDGTPYLFSFAITEPNAGSDVENAAGASGYRPGCRAQKVEKGYLLNGRKVFISGGDRADAITVSAALEGQGMESWTCFLVHKGNPGFSVGRTEHKMGQRASTAAELIFEDVLVTPDNLIGKPKQGWAINKAVLNISRIPVGAAALGIARSALESCIEFAYKAKLGGKPLIHYQDVQLAIAHMVIQTNAMRSFVWHEAKHWRPIQSRSASVKVFCSQAATEVCTKAMDLLGNHALVHKNQVEKAFRDVRLTEIYEGTTQINQLAIIEDLQSHLFLDTTGSNTTHPH